MILFFAALTVLDGLLLWLLVHTKGSWIPRAIAIVAAVLVNAALLFSALPGPSGRATTAEPPSGNQFLACAVDEPRAIYLWLLVDGEPRGYRQPYSRQLHEVCEQARQAQKQGASVGLRHGRPSGSRGSSLGHWHPYILPPALPPKS